MGQSKMVGLILAGIFGVSIAAKMLYNRGCKDGSRDTLLKVQGLMIKNLFDKSQEEKAE